MFIVTYVLHWLWLKYIQCQSLFKYKAPRFISFYELLDKVSSKQQTMNPVPTLDFSVVENQWWPDQHGMKPVFYNIETSIIYMPWTPFWVNHDFAPLFFYGFNW